MTVYNSLTNLLGSYELMDIILPFLLIFTIIFAVLEKSEVLGKKKNFNVMIALIFALTVIIPHSTGGYASGYDPVDIINNALPAVSIVAVAAIAFLIIIGVFGAQTRWLGTSISGWIAIVAFIFVIFIFASAAGWTGGFYMEDFVDSDTMTLIIIILVFAIIINYITKTPGEGENVAKLGHTLEGIGDFFGKKGK